MLSSDIKTVKCLQEQVDYLQTHLDDAGLELTPDGLYVRWSKGNPKHPRNWSFWRKVHDSSLVIWLDLFTSTIGTTGAAAASVARHEFQIGRTYSVFIFVTLYLIGQGIGGVIFPSYSETFGRRKLYITSAVFFAISCIITGIVPFSAGVIVGRFMCGFSSSIPSVVVAGSIEDMFNTKDRIWLIAIWAVVANSGFVTGPIVGAYIGAALGWRWVFYTAAIVLAVTTLLLFNIRESRPSLLLVREVAKLRALTDNQDLHALNPDHAPSLRAFAREALFRPLHLLFTEPIVTLVSFLNGLAASLIYLLTEALPPIYELQGFSVSSANLPFLAVGVGCFIGLPVRILDNRKLGSLSRPPQPEDKLLGFLISAPVLAVSLWWFAWTIPPQVHVHWMVPTVSLALIGYTLTEFDTVLVGYLADSYLSYSASALAALMLLRSSMSASFPLFATHMFDALTPNVAVSVLAALATAFAFVPWCFTKYGERIRARSKFAKYSLQVYQDNSVDQHGY